MSKKYTFFPYSWHIDNKQTNVTCIRIYGLDFENNTICVRVNDFTPFCYLELPSHINWTEEMAVLLHSKICQNLTYKPISYSLHFKKKLYYASFDNNGNRKKFPFLFLAFSNKQDITQLSFKLRDGFLLPGIGRIKVKMHEHNADQILQLVCRQNIYTAGWVEFYGKLVEKDDMLTYCKYEYICSYKTMKDYPSDKVPSPLILSFDIEVNSSVASAFPSCERKDDKIFQISCILFYQGDSEDKYDKYLLTLGEPNQTMVGNDVSIYMYDTESDLLDGFTEFINEKNPNVITGYNIFGFDIKYMLDRSCFPCLCNDSFTKMGFLKDVRSEEKTVSWSSSAYGEQNLKYLDTEGRLFIDLLPIVKRNYKMNIYTLKFVSTELLGDTKDDLPPTGIFKCYKLGFEKKDGQYTKKAKSALAICGKYAVKDSLLVVKLFEKLQVWVDLVEMAKVTNVPIIVLYTQGQQIKVFSQVYKKCMYEGYVVEKDGYKVGDNEHYTGAHVFEPTVGVHEKVIPFDFCLTGDTKISLNNGLSVRLDSLKNDSDVLTYKEDTLVDGRSINGLQYKGVKHTIKLILDHGRHLDCTPDHKIMMANGEWEEAQNLKGKYIMSAIDYPLDVKYEEEKTWELDIDGYKFNMNTVESRNKSLAFARILGFVITAFNYSKNIPIIKFNSLVDCNRFENDVKLIDDFIPILGSFIFFIFLDNESKFLNYFRTNNISEKNIPSFLYDSPLSIIREFLAGYNSASKTVNPYIYPLVCKFMQDDMSDRNFLNKLGYRYNINKYYNFYHLANECEKFEENIVDITCFGIKVLEILNNGMRKVYDIEVKDTHNFVANGVVVHNCSLYPSTMIANNICWSTLVNDRWDYDDEGKKIWIRDKTIKDVDCHVIEWYDHVNCAHDAKKYITRPKHTMCEERKYRFLKSPIGILPKLLTNLLQARSDTKDKLKDVKKQIKSGNLTESEKKDLELLSIVLDKRQLALKVSANSAYGALGVQKGSLPLMPGAMCTTAKGREYLMKTAEILQTQHNAKLIYGDTDSNYVIFNDMKDKSAKEIWEHSEKVAEDVSKNFPHPVSLAFEEKIYWVFLILAKKKYMCLSCDKDGKMSTKVEKRGCVLVRRDTSAFVRETYEKILHKIFKGDKEDIIKPILDETLSSLFNYKIDISKFIITKSIKSTNNLQVTDLLVETCLDKKGNPKMDKNGEIKTRKTCKIGSYKVLALDNSDPVRYNKQLHDKKALNEEDFYLRSLGSHVQLAEKMKRRGKPVESGTRLEYVITWDETLRSVIKDKQWEKIESAEYFINHSDMLKIDYMYYFDCLCSSLDEILNVVFTEKDYLYNIYKSKLDDLKFNDKLRPKIIFKD